ncbi:PP2C family protein-serine/threonine phosphatase [Aeromicrobium sp. CTD01-1L150]|uniref:PP2C family protein-serine/threonine phosphatase n=1 Tax=Aeromicrobium sp. CTD01-1L150 TaxID=3341830 RepID=UPI0035BF524A
MILRRVMPSAVAYIDQRFIRWRTGTTEGQVAVLSVLIAMSIAILVGSIVVYGAFPAVTFVVPLLLGSLTLRYRPLWVLVFVVAVAVVVTTTIRTLEEGTSPGRVSSIVTLALVAAILLFEARRRRSGLPGPLGEAMLVDLNDRLQAQGVVPPLPLGWRSQSAMKSAGGAKFSGDFLVADLSDDKATLEMILVDVCGKGVAAGTQSLQLAGALGGLIGSLPPLGLFAAANDYLLRQDWEEGFATAVHVIANLQSGSYSIISAGHPPALRWNHDEWVADSARGVALGLLPRPQFDRTVGTLAPGEALLFYTDGIVETRDRDIDEGVDWLRGVAQEAMTRGVDGLARRVIDQVPVHDDDRAVLVLSRDD